VAAATVVARCVLGRHATYHLLARGQDILPPSHLQTADAAFPPGSLAARLCSTAAAGRRVHLAGAAGLSRSRQAGLGRVTADSGVGQGWRIHDDMTEHDLRIGAARLWSTEASTKGCGRQ
jgi:hypothetical protein